MRHPLSSPPHHCHPRESGDPSKRCRRCSSPLMDAWMAAATRPADRRQCLLGPRLRGDDRSVVWRGPAAMTTDDLDLSTLPDDELVAQMHDDLYDGLAPEIEEGVRILLKRALDALRRPDQGAGRGHARRRRGFPRRHPVRPRGAARGQRHEGRDGDPPAAPGRDRRAEDRQDGDRHRQGRHPRHRQEPRLHDDGGRRLRRHRPRRQQRVEKYLAAIEEHRPDIIGMSALLTTTMPYMKVVIDTLKEKGMRSDYIVLVGGAPVNEAFARVGRRRRLLPRRGDRGRDRQGPDGPPPGLGAGARTGVSVDSDRARAAPPREGARSPRSSRLRRNGCHDLRIGRERPCFGSSPKGGVRVDRLQAGRSERRPSSSSPAARSPASSAPSSTPTASTA